MASKIKTISYLVCLRAAISNSLPSLKNLCPASKRNSARTTTAPRNTCELRDLTVYNQEQTSVNTNGGRWLSAQLTRQADSPTLRTADHFDSLDGHISFFPTQSKHRFANSKYARHLSNVSSKMTAQRSYCGFHEASEMRLVCIAGGGTS